MLVDLVSTTNNLSLVSRTLPCLAIFSDHIILAKLRGRTMVVTSLLMCQSTFISPLVGRLKTSSKLQARPSSSQMNEELCTLHLLSTLRWHQATPKNGHSAIPPQIGSWRQTPHTTALPLIWIKFQTLATSRVRASLTLVKQLCATLLCRPASWSATRSSASSAGTIYKVVPWWSTRRIKCKISALKTFSAGPVR